MPCKRLASRWFSVIAPVTYQLCVTSCENHPLYCKKSDGQERADTMVKPWALGGLVLVGNVLLVGCGMTNTVASNPPVHSSHPQSAPAASKTSSSAPVPSTSSKTAAWKIGPMDFINPSTGWIVGRGVSSIGKPSAEAIFATQNGGQSWTRLTEWKPNTLPLPPNTAYGSRLPPISQLDFQNAQVGSAVVFLGDGACQAQYAILSTTDGGRQWSLHTHAALMGEDGPFDLSLPSSNIGWFANGSCAGTGLGVSKSVDGGQHWSSVASLKTSGRNPAQAISFRFTSPTQGYVINGVSGYQKVQSSLTLYTTRDSGLNWAETSIPSKGLPNSIASLSFINPEQGWVVAAVPNHRFQVYHFQSGTWTPLTIPYSSVQNPAVDLVSSQVAYLNQPMGWASLWKTVDGGVHWTPVSFPTN